MKVSDGTEVGLLITFCAELLHSHSDARACAQVLGAKEGFFVKLVDSVVANFGGFYPELVAKRDHITEVIRCESLITLAWRSIRQCKIVPVFKVLA